MADLASRVRAYYETCNGGDAEAIAAWFTGDAVHTFTRLPPARGATAIAELTAQAVANLAASWALDRAIEQGDEAVVEWSNAWTDPRTGERKVTRGTEWFVFAPDGRIAEVRAYY